jgi:DNA-binding response OmpR family regulator
VSRRILIVEPDASGRAMMHRVLAAEGFAPESVASAHDARALLDAGAVSLSIIDELAGRGSVLEELRWLRRSYPALPVIAMGALLSQRVMQELLRLRAVDALVKPFTPVELREAVARAFGQLASRRAEALEYDAAVGAAREAIAEGRLAEARTALSRAQAIAPFDAEIMALLALGAELSGHDEDADRAYRAALALRCHEDSPPPDPHEGLARLAAYAGAQPVDALGPTRAGAPIWLVADPARELRGGPPASGATPVLLLGLGLGEAAPGTLFFRDGEGTPAFALIAGALGPESIAHALATLRAGPLLAGEATRAIVELERVEHERVEHERVEHERVEAHRARAPS